MNKAITEEHKLHRSPTCAVCHQPLPPKIGSEPAPTPPAKFEVGDIVYVPMVVAVVKTWVSEDGENQNAYGVENGEGEVDMRKVMWFESALLPFLGDG